MLWNREDAEDATQEILIRIVTIDFARRLLETIDRRRGLPS
jgi:hypothetical protein